MLAVVEQHQHLAIANEPAQHVCCPLAGLVGQTERACHRHWYHVGIGERGEVDVPDTVGEFGGHYGRDLYREACFPRTARAGQCDEPVVAERLADVVNFCVAPNETRQLRRETLGGNDIGRAQGREVVVQVGMAKLHHAFGAGQIAQRVGAQIGERDTLGELVDDKRFGRTREHRLAAVGQVAEPSGAVDRRSDVVAFIAQLHVAGVQADA